MAIVSDCFAIGSTVACKTCDNTVIEGEVQAFDPQTKMLVLSILSIRVVRLELYVLYHLTPMIARILLVFYAVLFVILFTRASVGDVTNINRRF